MSIRLQNDIRRWKGNIILVQNAELSNFHKSTFYIYLGNEIPLDFSHFSYKPLRTFTDQQKSISRIQNSSYNGYLSVEKWSEISDASKKGLKMWSANVHNK